MRLRLLACCVTAVAACGVAADAGTTELPPPAPHALPDPDPVLHQLLAFRVRYRDLLRRHDELVRILRVPYRANDGSTRVALLVLPRWYGPRLDPPIPLVISPTGEASRPGTTRASGAACPRS